MRAHASIDDLLAAVQAAGATIRRDGNFLDIEASAPLPEDLLARIKEAKPALMSILTEVGIPPDSTSTRQRPTAGTADPWNAKDYRARFEELAAAAEHDGGLTRAKAEARAYESVLTHWWNNNLTASNPDDGCAWCGKPETPYAVIVPFGIGPHVWLHHACWGAWCASRRVEAATALAAIGIPVRPAID